MASRKMKLLALTIAVLAVSSGLMVIHFENSVSKIRVACIGDSLTQLTQYPDYLQVMLGAGYKVSRFSTTGATVLHSTNKPYLNQTALGNATAFLPDVVVIMLGTNDARINIYSGIDNFVSDYKKIVSAFQNLTSTPKIWLVKPPPIFENNLSLSNDNLVEGVIPRIAEVAQELGLPMIDVYTTLVNYPTYFIDGVHVNYKGAKVIATEIYKAIA